MEVFRISSEKYASKLTAFGAANRWNKTGQFVIYTGSSRALSTLELLVNINSIRPLKTVFKTMIIEIPVEKKLLKEIALSDLPENWRSKTQYPMLQELGSDWYLENNHLLLKVPSAVILQEFNFIINTRHPEFKQIQLVKTEPFFWDKRLI